MNKEQLTEVIAMHRYNYSNYTISCTLDIDLGTVDRAVASWEESQKPAGGGGKGRR